MYNIKTINKYKYIYINIYTSIQIGYVEPRNRETRTSEIWHHKCSDRTSLSLSSFSTADDWFEFWNTRICYYVLCFEATMSDGHVFPHQNVQNWGTCGVKMAKGKDLIRIPQMWRLSWEQDTQLVVTSNEIQLWNWSESIESKPGGGQNVQDKSRRSFRKSKHKTYSPIYTQVEGGRVKIKTK